MLGFVWVWNDIKIDFGLVEFGGVGCEDKIIYYCEFVVVF